MGHGPGRWRAAGPLDVVRGVYACPSRAATASAIGVRRERGRARRASVRVAERPSGVPNRARFSPTISQRLPTFRAGRSPRLIAARTARGLTPIALACPLDGDDCRDRSVVRSSRELGRSAALDVRRACQERCRRARPQAQRAQPPDRSWLRPAREDNGRSVAAPARDELRDRVWSPIPPAGVPGLSPSSGEGDPALRAGGALDVVAAHGVPPVGLASRSGTLAVSRESSRSGSVGSVPRSAISCHSASASASGSALSARTRCWSR